jgi:hypothetical protein
MRVFETRFSHAIERGENMSREAILEKRRAYEAAHPSYPRWQSKEELQKMSDIRKDHAHELDKIIADANEGRVGKDATFLKLKQHFGKYHHSMTDLDPKTGDPRSVDQQMERWQKFAPEGQRAARAVKEALPDTHDEKLAALTDIDEHEAAARRVRGGTDTDDAHARQGELAGGHASGEYDATKINKNVQFGKNAPLSRTNNPAVLRVMKMAERLQKRLKDEKQITMSKDQCFAFLAENCETPKALLKLDKAIRLGPTFADPADYEAAVR